MTTARSHHGWTRPPLSGLAGLGLLALTGCAEENVGPQLDTPSPVHNACLDLSSESPETLASPTGLLKVFDCLNEQHSFDTLRAPLAYLVDTGDLDVYFQPGYLDPLHLDTSIQGGDISLAVQGLDTLLNDPSDPLGALMDVYVDLYDKGHIEALLRLTQVYTSYIFNSCTPESCPLLDMADDLYGSPALAVLQAQSESIAAQMDPRVADDLSYDLLYLARASTSAATGGDNLLLGLTASMLVNPAPSDPYKTVDDPYVASGATLLESLQGPLCQMRSDRGTFDALLSMSGDMGETGLLDYLPLYLRTLTNASPTGVPVTTTAPDSVDHDQDGFSIAQGDCNDADPTTYLHALETADRKDNNCDLAADNIKSNSTIPTDDQDGDGVAPSQGDCDDTDASIHPGLKIAKSDGSVIVIQPGTELDAEGVGDLKDNDCDGFVDHTASSLEILLGSARVLLPSFYAPHDATQTNLDYVVGLSASQGALDIGALLDANAALIDSTITNLNNGLIPPELTARMRIALPVVDQLVSMGLLSSSSLGALAAINDDHKEYEANCRNEDGSIKNTCLSYQNSCGESYDAQVDTLKVLDKVVMLLDAYSLLDEPHLNALLPILINSDLLVDAVKVVPLSYDENGQMDPDAINAMLELFDYFIAPPADEPGVYSDNYAGARLWSVTPLVGLLYQDPAQVAEIDALMTYVLEGIDDPASPVYGVSDALALLSQIDTGATVDTDALIHDVLDPDSRYILLNALYPVQDPYLTDILLGDWDALPADLKAKYEPASGQSTLAYVTGYIKDGKVDALLGLAGNLVSWIVDNTTLGEPTSTIEDPPIDTTDP